MDPNQEIRNPIQDKDSILSQYAPKLEIKAKIGDYLRRGQNVAIFDKIRIEQDLNIETY